MKQKIIALRYLLGAFAVSAALAVVCFAQSASSTGGGQGQGTQQAAPAIEWPADPISMIASEWTRARIRASNASPRPDDDLPEIERSHSAA